MEDIEQLSQADKINCSLYTHKIFFTGYITFTAWEEKYDFIQIQGKFTNQKVLFVRKIINFTVMNEFPVYNPFYKFMQCFFCYLFIFNDVSINPEKIKRTYRRIKSIFRKLVKELFHNISPWCADIEVFLKSRNAILTQGLKTINAFLMPLSKTTLDPVPEGRYLASDIFRPEECRHLTDHPVTWRPKARSSINPW